MRVVMIALVFVCCIGHFHVSCLIFFTATSIIVAAHNTDKNICALSYVCIHRQHKQSKKLSVYEVRLVCMDAKEREQGVVVDAQVSVRMHCGYLCECNSCGVLMIVSCISIMWSWCGLRFIVSAIGRTFARPMSYFNRSSNRLFVCVTGGLLPSAQR